MTGQTAPTRSCRTHVEAGVMAWPCELPEGHDGPCAAKDAPASLARRKIWEAEQPAQQTFATPNVEPGAVVALPANMLLDEAGRLASLEALVARSINDMPAPVRDWAISMMALTSLGALWHVALAQFEAGASAVSIDRDLLDRLVPAIVRRQIGVPS